MTPSTLPTLTDAQHKVLMGLWRQKLAAAKGLGFSPYDHNPGPARTVEVLVRHKLVAKFRVVNMDVYALAPLGFRLVPDIIDSIDLELHAARVCLDSEYCGIRARAEQALHGLDYLKAEVLAALATL